MPLRVLFIGDLNEYSKSFARLRILDDLGVQATSLSHTASGNNDLGHPEFSLAYRAAHKLGIALDTEGINRSVLDAAAASKPDIIWIEKGLMVRAATLRRLREQHPAARLVSYSDDDMFLPHNRSRDYTAGLQHYDCVFTTKAANTRADELLALGAQRVVLVDKAYDPKQHLPLSIDDADQRALGSDVGFVGTFEQDRADKLIYLAENDVPVRVWGNDWSPAADWPSNMRVEGLPLVNTDSELRYSKSIAATRINLGFLRKLNRDLHSDRSIEIPACGGFMLAERTADHRRLFVEDKEAVYFSSAEELLAKVRYYLDHDDERRRIARAGRERCVKSGYSEIDRMRFMLSQALGANADDADRVREFGLVEDV